MAGLYIVGLLAVLGFVQGEVIDPELAYIEDIRNAANSRIIGGWAAEDGQFPHSVSLRMVGPTGGVSGCGGSILTNEWILSAAHCLARRVTYVISVGQTNMTRPGYMLEATERYIYDTYDQTSTAVQTDDIGLLKLDRYVPYGDYIQPIRIQSSQRRDLEYGGVQLTISGYGRLNDWWAEGGILPDNLQWVYQRGLTAQECRSWYPNSQVLDVQTLCAQYYNETSQNTCTGDSGGALTMVDLDGKVTQVGLLSFGPARGCNTPNPQGFVRPEFYHEWIEEITGISFDWNVEDLETRRDDVMTYDQPMFVN